MARHITLKQHLEDAELRAERAKALAISPIGTG
jgi:hypothetical protein